MEIQLGRIGTGCEDAGLNLFDYILGGGPPVKTREEIVQRIQTLTRRKGRTDKTKLMTSPKKWLPSEHFVLKRIATNQIESPVRAKYAGIIREKVKHPDKEPIVIDKTPGSLQSEYKTSTYVGDGKHRLAMAKKLKWPKMKAWVGINALPFLEERR